MKCRYHHYPMTPKRIGRRVTLADRIRRAWKKDLDYAADLLAKKAEREKQEFIKLNKGFA